MPVASASTGNAITDWTDMEGVTVGKNFENREIRASLIESEAAMAKLKAAFDDKSGYKNYTKRIQYTNGWVEEYYDDQRCESWAITPGTTLLNKGLMGFCYLVWLMWLFVGISIVSDIFMESIEEITAQTTTVEITNPETGENMMVEQKIWNETMANLTLMALGSSAPEILLNLIMTAQNPGEEPSELGPSTIVGSASFNLLVISGVSIIAVDDVPKKIARPGVFFITSVFSLFAYIWLFLVLVSISPERVEMWEAVLTFVFFPVLLIISYGIDRYEVY